MHSSFRWRLTGTYLLLIAIVLTFTGLELSYMMKDFFLDNYRSSLTYEALLVSELAAAGDGDRGISFLSEVAATAARDTDTRVTIVDSQGRVLADSEFDPALMESHYHRPEIYEALKNKTGIDIRMSDTASISFLYVAVPFKNSAVSGAIRLAKPLQQINYLYHQILYIFIMAIAVTGLVAFAVSFLVARRFANPINELTEAVSDMAQGNLKRRVKSKFSDELGVLANAVNRMAEYLDNSISKMAKVNNRLETVLTNTVNGILMVDNNNRVTYANPVAMELIGANRNYMGRKHVEVICNYQLIEAIDQVKEQVRPVRKEIDLFNSGDKKVEMNVVPILERNHQDLHGILVVLNDISEVKRLEQVRKDFVANVSHELKTPIATISGFAETLLSENPDTSDNIHEFSQIIYDESQRLSRIINQLLELSRLESERPRLNMQIIDLNRVIYDAVEVIKQKFTREKLSLEVVLPEEKILIEADEEAILQVLVNLIDNAVKYTPQEEKQVTIKVEKLAEQVRIAIEDQGEGISPSEAPRIFERFYRVDKARSRRTGGSGLGLAIVKHLVENHGGQVGVDSVPGQGSTFFFTIPL